MTVDQVAEALMGLHMVKPRDHEEAMQVAEVVLKKHEAMEDGQQKAYLVVKDGFRELKRRQTS